MVETSAVHKKLVGNVALHLALVPERRFLQRNLRHVLDAHEQSLQRIANPDGTASTTNPDMIANKRRRISWDYPSSEMLRDLTKGQKPLLRIEALQIREPQSRASIEGSRLRRDGDQHAENWIPPPNVDFLMPCTVTVGVADHVAHKTRIFEESRPATIRQSKDDRGDAYYDVDLDQPFLIGLDKLFTVESKGSSPFRWKRTVTARYILDVGIRCRDSEDTAELLGRLEGKEVSSYAKTPPVDGILKATWDNLPECPSADQLRTLKRSKGHNGDKPMEPEYQMEIAMAWARRKDTPLEQYNQSRTRVTRAARQLPTPTASEDLDKGVETCEVVYKYEEGAFTRTLTVNGLKCPLCPKSREQPSIERLRLHCATFHDHFKFEPEQAARTSRRADKTRLVVWISLAEKEIEKERDKQDTEQISWIAPARPFDISAHLDGKDNWTGTRVRKSKGSRTRTGWTAKAKDSASSGPPRPVRKRPALDEVEALPKEQQRKRRTPNVPSVQFYHPMSKLAIQPDSLTSGADDTTDQTWMQEKERFLLDKYEVGGTKKEFIIAYNEHMEREQPHSTIFVREALVRFARRYEVQLQDAGWKRRFKEKLKLLVDHSIVTDETAGYCLDLVERPSDAMDMDGSDEVDSGVSVNGATEPSPDTNSNPPVRTRKQWKNGEYVTREPPDDLSSPTDPTALQKGRDAATSGLCKCGREAAHGRAAIFCANHLCLRKHYHLGCVGLERRIPGWRCADCA